MRIHSPTLGSRTMVPTGQGFQWDDGSKPRLIIEDQLHCQIYGTMDAMGPSAIKSMRTVKTTRQLLHSNTQEWQVSRPGRPAGWATRATSCSSSTE